MTHRRKKKTTWSVWQQFAAALWVITVHILALLALSLFPPTTLQTDWVLSLQSHVIEIGIWWKNQWKINPSTPQALTRSPFTLTTSDLNDRRLNVRLSPVSLRFSIRVCFCWRDQMTWCCGVRGCVRCAVTVCVCGGGSGGAKRGCLLTGLMYQPWRSQFIDNLKNRWEESREWDVGMVKAPSAFLHFW